MAQGQQIIPDTLPGGFSQWDSMPTGAPSAPPDTLPSNFSGFDTLPEEENKSSAVMRFLKAGAGRYVGATLNAGPTNAVPRSYGTPEWQQAEANLPKTNSEAFSRMWQSVKDLISAPAHADPLAMGIDLAKQVNPIDVQKFQSGDVAGGLGSSLMNLLLIRSGFKQMRGAQVPEFGSPLQNYGSTSEFVQPLTGYTKSVPRQQLALPAAPIELGPSSLSQTIEGVLPAARKVYANGQVQYLTRPLRPGEAPDVPKNTNTLAQDYFIQKMREGLERQTVTGSAEQDAAMQRMQDYAKTPVDKAGQTIEGASNLNSPGQVRGFQEQAALKMFGKSYDSLSVAEKLQTISEATKIQNAARSTTPRVPTSTEDMQNLLMQSLQMVRKAKAAKAGD
jgi:hypothetical protein